MFRFLVESQELSVLPKPAPNHTRGPSSALFEYHKRRIISLIEAPSKMGSLDSSSLAGLDKYHRHHSPHPPNKARSPPCSALPTWWPSFWGHVSGPNIANGIYKRSKYATAIATEPPVVKVDWWDQNSHKSIPEGSWNWAGSNTLGRKFLFGAPSGSHFYLKWMVIFPSQPV